jgi:general secretion pathway protein G
MALNGKQKMKKIDIGGFTLVELLIVVIILGILAAVVIPTFKSSAAETSESALMSNLVILRSAIEHYHIQHGGTWPGTISGSSDWNNFITHMITTTGQDGSSGTQYGPYLRVGVPRNPINNLATGTVGTIPAEADDSTGWYYDPTTGEIRANSSGSGPSTGFNYIDM